MEKTRFSFNSKEHVLAEKLEPLTTPIVMFWEKTKEMCPHCKETITKGEHHVFTSIEFWLPFDVTPNEATIADIVMIGKNSEVVLLLSKDKLQEALLQSKVFQRLVLKD